MSEDKRTDRCCPPFDPEPWQGKEHVWQDRLFIQGSMFQFLHMPFPPLVSRLIGRLWKQAQDAGAAPTPRDFLWLAYDPSPFKGVHLVAVTREVPGADNVKLSGTFLTKVYDGPYNAVPRWIKDLKEFVTSKGKTVRQYYFYYTTCPRCAKEYGHNYVVAFAQVE